MTPAGAHRLGVVWARVEDDFHVASEGGVFLGYIDRQVETFFAYDERPQFIGEFPSLPLAMTAVCAERTWLSPETGRSAAVRRLTGGWTGKASDD